MKNKNNKGWIHFVVGIVLSTHIIFHTCLLFKY